ncbi:MAG: rod-binding protein [Planctomycetota bacterium]
MTPITDLMTPNASMFAASASGAPSTGEIAPGEMSAEQIESVGTDFEGVFLSLMLKEMRKSLDEGGFFSGEGSDTYGGMFDMFIGQHLAQSKPLGIGQMLVDQYDRIAKLSESASSSGAEQQAGGQAQTSTSWSA